MGSGVRITSRGRWLNRIFERRLDEADHFLEDNAGIDPPIAVHTPGNTGLDAKDQGPASKRGGLH